MYIFDSAQLKIINPKRAFNIVKLYSSYYYSRFTKQVWLAGYPAVLSIEPTSLCNLKCPQCPTGLGTLNRQDGYMDMQTYRSIVDELGDYLTTIQFFFQGEPFMHKNLPEMISYAKSKNIYTLTSTNGHYLSEKSVNAILDSGLDTIVVGLDGVSPEVYKFYRRNGKFDLVVQGIKRLISERNKRGLKHPKTVLQFIVFKSNENQVDDVKKFGKELNFDKVVIKTAQIYPESNIDDFLPEDPTLTRYKKENGTIRVNGSIPNHCKRVWTQAVFTWDGVLASCCFDKDAGHAFGKWKPEPGEGVNPFFKIWKSEKGIQFRKQILKNRSEIPMCGNCTEGIKEFR